MIDDVSAERTNFDRRALLARELGWFASGLSIVSAPPEAEAPGAEDRVAAIVATGLLSLPIEAVDEGIERALAVIGHYQGVDRAFYYRLDQQAAALTLTHEWNAPGSRPMKDLAEYSRLPLSILPPAFRERLKQGGVLRLPQTHGFLAGPVTQLVPANDDRALVLVPACVGGALIGVAGLAMPRADWDQRHVAMLQIVTQGIARLVERKSIECALRTSEARFRAICESSPIGIFLSDDKGGCIYTNPAAQITMGLSHDEAMGGGWMTALHPDDRARIVNKWSGTVKELSPYQTPVHRFVHKGGDVRSVMVRAVPLQSPAPGGGYLGVLEDVTERLRAETERTELFTRAEAARAEAEAARNEIASVLARVSDGFVALDAQGRYTYANGRALAILGRTRETLIGREMFAEFPEAAGGVFEQAYRRAVTQQQSTSAEHFSTVRARCYETRVYPSPTGVSIFFEDITDRRAREEELRNDREYLKEELGGAQVFHEIVGLSPALRSVIDKVRVVAATNTTVLVTGETGTGKELIARAIHDGSPRAERILVKVNCAAISAGLVESELFGHEKGAFTGALQRRKGRFELADHGTLFLDEVGELPLDMQGKLLRVLQEREFERVGGSETVRVDVRVVAATNRNLADMVAQGKFREDLFYRLNVFPVALPPLRQRAADLPALVHAFVQRFAREAGRRINGVSADGMRRLCAYRWPGNVRELQNVIERAVILTRGAIVELDALPDLAGAVAPDAESPAPEATFEGEGVGAVERNHVEKILRETGWVIEGDRGAAQRLRLHPNTLRSRLKRWGLTRPASRLSASFDAERTPRPTPSDRTWES